MLYTTFRLAKAAVPCDSGYRKAAQAVGSVRRYGRDTLTPVTMVLDFCGVRDALWVMGHCTTEPEEAERLLRIAACDFAEHVLTFYESVHAGDTRVRDCITVAQRYANGKATEEELATASDAAWAIFAGGGSRCWVARVASSAAARDSTFAATHAAFVAAATWDAEREWQAQHLRELLERGKHGNGQGGHTAIRRAMQPGGDSREARGVGEGGVRDYGKAQRLSGRCNPFMERGNNARSHSR